MRGWYGFDLDGTIAKYDKWIAPDVIGEPVMPMIEFMKDFIRRGELVKIYTARVWPMELSLNFSEMDAEKFNVIINRLKDAHRAKRAIEYWSLQNLGTIVPITHNKDFAMLTLYDDRVVQVEKNTGRLIFDVQAEGHRVFDTHGQS